MSQTSIYRIGSQRSRRYLKHLPSSSRSSQLLSSFFGNSHIIEDISSKGYGSDSELDKIDIEKEIDKSERSSVMFLEGESELISI